MCISVPATHRLPHTGKAADSCCGSLSEAELSINPSSPCLWGEPLSSPLIHLFSLSCTLSVHRHPSLTPAHTIISLWTFVILQSFTTFPSFRSLVCHTLTTSFASFSLSIHDHCYSFDSSSLTLLISIWAPSFSLSVSPCVSLPLSCWGGLDGRWVIAAFATLQMIYLPTRKQGREWWRCV